MVRVRYIQGPVLHQQKLSIEPIMRKAEDDKSDSIFDISPRLKLDMRENKKKQQSTRARLQYSLKQEIMLLQKRLEDQFMVRRVFEKASSEGCFSHEAAIKENPTLKTAEDLTKEIALLELQVVYLEKYLLSMYRKKFQSTSVRSKEMFSEIYSENNVDDDTMMSKKHRVFPPRISTDSSKEHDEISIQRCHSSLSQRSFRTPSMGNVADAVKSGHSLPLSLLERADDATFKVPTLAEYLDNHSSEHEWDTPNRLSEDMIKCISAIYCKLADPCTTNHDFRSSPVSFSEPMNMLNNDMWSSLECKQFSSFSSNLGKFEKSKEYSGPYCNMVEVQWVCKDSKKLRETHPMLQNFRLLISRLEEVDPRKMKHEEKLAFWINVHNALVMHAFLVYEIPQNSLKRMSLILKAAYNIGGETVSVAMIQRSFLGCRLPQPGQWLRLSFYPKTKFKAGERRTIYGIDHPEPLLHFALSSGCRSDPAVRIYTSKHVFQELESAREEYIEMNFRVTKYRKIVLPKIVNSFATDSGMFPDGLMEMIEHSMPYYMRKRAKQCQSGKIRKSIKWAPHNFSFRYLFSRELAK